MLWPETSPSAKDSILDALKPEFKSFVLKRPLHLGTGCSGTGSPRIALEYLGFPLREIYSADPKQVCLQMASNCNARPSHHFDTCEDIAHAHSGGAYCYVHNDYCHLDLQREDLAVFGFPCAPYSSQRPGRYAAGAWESHPQTEVMFETIRAIRARQPYLVLLENVPGFLRASRRGSGTCTYKI